MASRSPALPRISIYHRWRGAGIDKRWLRRVWRAALPLCLTQMRHPQAPLAGLEEIEMTLVSDAEIGRVHEDFLDDPSPTDVITFHHGEILISPETAERQRLAHGKSLAEEVALYGIHGFMHLGGWDDHEPAEAAAMAVAQEKVLAAVLALHPARDDG